MKKISILLSFIFVSLVVIFGSSCSSNRQVYEKNSYWQRRHPYDHKGDRYYYPTRNKENKPRRNSYRF